MTRYSFGGAAAAASTTAASAGIIKIENPGSATMAAAQIYEFSIGPSGNAEDSNYTIRMKRQTTPGTWTSGTAAPLDPKASNAITSGAVASTVAGTASTVLGWWGFNQRGGMRWVAVPGGEFCLPLTFANGIMLEYVTVQGAATNQAMIFFYE